MWQSLPIRKAVEFMKKAFALSLVAISAVGLAIWRPALGWASPVTYVLAVRILVLAQRRAHASRPGAAARRLLEAVPGPGDLAGSPDPHIPHAGAGSFWLGGFDTREYVIW